MKKDPSITQEDFNKKRELFGVIVFESDQDLDPLTAYLCYEDRWQIELLFDAYKTMSAGTARTSRMIFGVRLRVCQFPCYDSHMPPAPPRAARRPLEQVLVQGSDGGLGDRMAQS